MRSHEGDQISSETHISDLLLKMLEKKMAAHCTAAVTIYACFSLTHNCQEEEQPKI